MFSVSRVFLYARRPSWLARADPSLQLHGVKVHTHATFPTNQRAGALPRSGAGESNQATPLPKGPSLYSAWAPFQGITISPQDMPGSGSALLSRPLSTLWHCQPRAGTKAAMPHSRCHRVHAPNPSPLGVHIQAPARGRGWQWSLGRGVEGEARWTCGARGWGVSSREQTPGRWWEVLRGGSWSTLRIKSLVRHGPIRLPLQSTHSRLMSIEKWETVLETKP